MCGRCSSCTRKGLCPASNSPHDPEDISAARARRTLHLDFSLRVGRPRRDADLPPLEAFFRLRVSHSDAWHHRCSTWLRGRRLAFSRAHARLISDDARVLFGFPVLRRGGRCCRISAGPPGLESAPALRVLCNEPRFSLPWPVLFRRCVTIMAYEQYTHNPSARGTAGAPAGEVPPHRATRGPCCPSVSGEHVGQGENTPVDEICRHDERS